TARQRGQKSAHLRTAHLRKPQLQGEPAEDREVQHRRDRYLPSYRPAAGFLRPDDDRVAIAEPHLHAAARGHGRARSRLGRLRRRPRVAESPQRAGFEGFGYCVEHQQFVFEAGGVFADLKQPSVGTETSGDLYRKWADMGMHATERASPYRDYRVVCETSSSSPVAGVSRTTPTPDA